jgi:uncharacterized protein (DUF3084 family)
MKILKNSTYEGMCQEIEGGKKEIEHLKEQIKIEIGERCKAIAQMKESNNEVERLKKENEKIREERGFYEMEMNQAKDDFARVFAENAQLKNQTAERKPQRTSNGRFAKKKDNE